MCGIAGIIDYNIPSESRTNKAALMADSLYRRGPDSHGLWSDDRVRITLAHRRLAIQDLSPLGHQPMHSKSGRYTIVFNGEIYNFRSIRQELESVGSMFIGHSDTEVLLEAIDTFGLEKALQKSRGMFALALFDKTEKIVVLARDRIGEKPLYYSYTGSRLSFASDLNALSKSFDKKPSLNKNAIASYFRYGYISAPHSVYNEVNKLLPSEFIVFHLGETAIGEPLTRSYWNLPSGKTRTASPLTNSSKLITSIDATINSAIQEQSISDVALGSFLSGGIDSTTVSAILQSQSSIPIDTFTIGFNDKSFNEAEFAKKIAGHIGSRHTELYVSGADALDLIPSIPTVYDEPFADSSQIPMYLVSKLARSSVTVCLSGDGGDELFCGYNRYLQAQRTLKHQNRIPSSLRPVLKSLIQNVKPSSFDHAYAIATRLLGKRGGANSGAKLHKFAELICSESPSSAYKFLCSYWQNPQKLF